MTPEMLTEELLYAEDGHASDVVLRICAGQQRVSGTPP